MAELEKVIKGLENCSNLMFCESCPYNDKPVGCFTRLKSDALELLKEREPAKGEKPIRYGLVFWKCNACGMIITEGDKFCRECGRSVMWE